MSERVEAALKIGHLVRFYNERDGGPVHRVVSVMSDGMIELHDMGGYFAPHLFAVADDIADIPPRAAADATPSDVAGLCWRLRETLEAMANRCSVDQILWNEHSNAVLEAAVEIARLAADNARLERLSLLGSRWRHIKSDHVYRVIGICRLEHSNAPAYLYVGHDGTVWARDMDEFLDGRFERLPSDEAAIRNRSTDDDQSQV